MNRNEGHDYIWDYAFLFVGFCCIILYDCIPNLSEITTPLNKNFNLTGFSDSDRSIIENIRHAFIHARIDTRVGLDTVSMCNVSVYDTKNSELYTTTTKKDVVQGYIKCMNDIESFSSNIPTIQSIRQLHKNILTIAQNQWQLLGYEPLFHSVCLLIIITDENKHHNRDLLFNSMNNLTQTVGCILDTSDTQLIHIFETRINVHKLRNALSHEPIYIKCDSISFEVDKKMYRYNPSQMVYIANTVSIYHELPYILMAFFSYKQNLLQHFSPNTQ